MFWVKTMVAFVVISAILVLGGAVERNLARQSRPIMGLILPVVTGVLAVALSVPNFIQSVSYPPSLVAVAASVALFVFYMIPSMTFVLIYTETRGMQKTKIRTRRDQSLDARRRVSHARMDVRQPSTAEQKGPDFRITDKKRIYSQPVENRSYQTPRRPVGLDRPKEKTSAGTAASPERPSWASNLRQVDAGPKKKNKRDSEWPKKRWH